MSRFTLPLETAFGSAGTALAGAKLYFYATGTATPQATYSNAALSVANANPVVANSAGLFNDIFLTPTATYKVVLKTSGDVTVWTADPISGSGLVSGDLDGLLTSAHLNGLVTSAHLAGLVNAAAISDTVAQQQAITDKLDLLQTGTGAVTRSLGDKVREQETVGDFGAVFDGTTNNAAAVAAMAAAKGYVRFPVGNCGLGTLTIDVPVFFDPGAYWTVAAAATVTIRRPVYSPKQWIFRGSGLVALSHSGNDSENARVAHVSWFGAYAAPSSAVDQAPFIQKACTAMGNTREAELEFDFGNYHIYTGPVTVYRGTHIKGPGTRRCVVRLNADGFNVFETAGVACKFSNIQFEVEAPLTQRLSGAYIRILHGECEVYDVQCYACFTGISVAAANARIDNVTGTFGTDFGAGSALVHILSGAGSRVSNIQAGTSSHGPEALVRIGGTGGAAANGFVIDNIHHINPSASVHLEAFGASIARGAISNVVYNGVSGTAPAYGIKLATASTFSLSDIVLSNVVIGSRATNGILFSQDSSGTLEDIALDNIDVTGTSGIGINFTRTDGTLANIRVSDTVNVLDRATPFAYSGTFTNIKIGPMARSNDAGPAVCWTATVADDAVMVLDLARSVFTSVGILSMTPTVGSPTYGMFAVRAASSPSVTAMTTASADVATATGVLSGTTGADNKVTVSSADKFIYIENRSGASQAVHFTLLTGL